MYEKLFEQSERLFKPFTEIWALQAQAAETLAKQQTSLMADVWNQSVLAMQNLPSQKNMDDVMRLQQTYWDSMSECFQEMMENTQGVMLETNRKISAVLQETAGSTEKMMVKSVKSAQANTNEAVKKAAAAPKKAMETSVKSAKTMTKAATAATPKSASTAGTNGAKSSAPAAGGAAKAEHKPEAKVEPAKNSSTSHSAAPSKSDSSS